MKKYGKKVILAAMSLGLLVQPVLSASAAGLDATYRNETEVRAMLNSKLKNFGATDTFTTQPKMSAPYAAGVLSQKTLNDALNLVNTIRYIAGVPNNVKLNSTYNQQTQAASLVNAVNKDLTHYPTKPSGMSNSLFALAEKGASSSNLGMGWQTLELDDSIMMYMDDSDSYNIDRLGHRRWILNPTMSATGFGAVKNMTAMYTFDRNATNQGYIDTVAWPAQTMPIEFFEAGQAWHVSTGTTVNKNSVNVTLKNNKTGKVWKFNSQSSNGYFNVNNDGYGEKGAIIFRPDGISSFNAGDSYSVTVTGNFETISYQVKFFSAEAKATPVKTLTSDIYKYDAGKNNYLTFINGRGYSQYTYLNTSGNYAFTPSSWMKAAGLTVTMPSVANGYVMNISNPYMKMATRATDLLTNVEAGVMTSSEIVTELTEIEALALDVPVVESNTKAVKPVKTKTSDIYKYDAGKGNHLTFINGRGYSQYTYLNTSGNYAFTPSSWMKAAGLTVSMPTASNGYKMQIKNPYRATYSKAVAEVESYLK